MIKCKLKTKMPYKVPNWGQALVAKEYYHIFCILRYIDLPTPKEKA